ncbi:MAG: hypothetical protein K8R07_00310 [Desulfobacterales bacterium]|nr:hypothetical protein [Desulfobacterales bacterium]
MDYIGIDDFDIDDFGEDDLLGDFIGDADELVDFRDIVDLGEEVIET